MLLEVPLLVVFSGEGGAIESDDERREVGVDSGDGF
jgi:hypothetical protein